MLSRLRDAVRAYIQIVRAWGASIFSRVASALVHGFASAQHRLGLNEVVWVLEGGKRRVIFPFALGVALVYVSILLIYSPTVTPPTPPAVQGAGIVFVDSSSARPVAVRLSVTVDPAVSHTQDRWPLTMRLEFIGPGALPAQPTSVRWALVLYGDARLVEGPGLIPPNAVVIPTLAANPPYSRGTKQDVQVITGTKYLTSGSNQASTLPLSGNIGREVFVRGGPKEAFSLPRFGRVEVDPLLEFAGERSAFEIGVPGEWSRPDVFEVQVDAGQNGTDQRVDLVSPDLDEPAKLVWKDDEAVTPILLRTSLSGEADAQRLTFILGAVVGAGAAAILTALERALTGFRRDGPGTSGSGGPPPLS